MKEEQKLVKSKIKANEEAILAVGKATVATAKYAIENRRQLKAQSKELQCVRRQAQAADDRSKHSLAEAKKTNARLSSLEERVTENEKTIATEKARNDAQDQVIQTTQALAEENARENAAQAAPIRANEEPAAAAAEAAESSRRLAQAADARSKHNLKMGKQQAAEQA